MAKLQSYAMSVALTKLQHKIITSKLGQKCIVIPIDDSAHSRQKVVYAIELAKQFSAHLYAVALLGPDEEAHKPAMELILHQSIAYL